jgi:hypothetical protein
MNFSWAPAGRAVGGVTATSLEAARKRNFS